MPPSDLNSRKGLSTVTKVTSALVIAFQGVLERLKQGICVGKTAPDVVRLSVISSPFWISSHRTQEMADCGFESQSGYSWKKFLLKFHFANYRFTTDFSCLSILINNFDY